MTPIRLITHLITHLVTHLVTQIIVCALVFLGLYSISWAQTTPTITETQIISSPAETQGFARSIAANETTLFVGSTNNQFGFGPSDGTVGRVFLFHIDHSTRTAALTGTLTPSGATDDDAIGFGFDIDIDGGLLVIGAPSTAESAACVFEKDANNDVWRQIARLTDTSLTARTVKSLVTESR